MVPRVRADATLGAQFEGSPNAINALRLALALEVVAWHSYSLRGGSLPPALQHFVADIGVDAFFAISGLLICRAWTRRPQVLAFLVARARRLLPGLWVCLTVTAFAIAPIACLLAGQPVPSLDESAHYAFSNAGIQVREWGIGDSPAGLPHAAWNGSLWSLSWEAYCYLAVAVLGVMGLLRGKLLLGFVTAVWSFCVLLEVVGIEPTSGAEVLWMPQRAALMFGSGALLWCYRDKLRMRSSYAVLSLAAVVMGVLLLSNYRILGAAPVAYLCVFVSLRLGRWARLRWSNDLSYSVYIYAFPLQQAILLTTGPAFGWLPFIVVSLSATLPLAYLSWRWVERPLLRRGAHRAAAVTQRSRVVLAAPESTASRARSTPAASASPTAAPGAS